tara:strand:+ start:1277 stop:2140 length:864 start_codon:yes stop_codon:yes gene_type:complete
VGSRTFVEVIYHRRMLRPAAGLLILALALVALACSGTSEPSTEVAPAEASAATIPDVGPNTLSADEVAEGWTLLFDGQTFDGWRGLGREEVPAGHWTIEDGAIKKIDSGVVPLAPDGQPLEGGDIMTVETYDDFELRFQWKVAPGANSGIKYNVSEAMSIETPPAHAALGFEFQVLDDDLHPDALNGPNRTAGALYDLLGPTDQKLLRSVGEFNDSRIVFDGPRGEHWLNGVKVVEFDLESADFAAHYAASKYDPIPGFADRRAGHIVLQDHGNDVWFRDIKMRTLP